MNIEIISDLWLLQTILQHITLYLFGLDPKSLSVG